MKRDKLLAEWFWIDRWMGSSAFLLPQEARGVYREMLTQAWRRGARLPNDHEAIRRATGTTSAEWRRAWPKLERYWRVDGDALVNDTQVEVYGEAVAMQERASERGRKGAQARAQATAQAGTQALHEHSPEHKPPSPSPSPSPDQRTENERSFSNSESPSPNGNGTLTEAEYADVVWSKFLERSGQPATRIMSPVEFATLKGWLDGGVPLRIVLRGLEDTKGKGSSLAYYGPSVAAAYDYYRQAMHS